MNEPFLLMESSGRIAKVTLNRPQCRNALTSHEHVDAIDRAMQRAVPDLQVSALIINGAGRCVSAGDDFKAVRVRRGFGALDHSVSTRDNYNNGIQRLFLTLGQNQSLGKISELSTAVQAQVHQTPDHREAIEARLEKPSPSYCGASS